MFNNDFFFYRYVSFIIHVGRPLKNTISILLGTVRIFYLIVIDNINIINWK